MAGQAINTAAPASAPPSTAHTEVVADCEAPEAAVAGVSTGTGVLSPLEVVCTMGALAGAPANIAQVMSSILYNW